MSQRRAAAQAEAAADALDRFLQARGNTGAAGAAPSSALAVSADQPTKSLETSFGPTLPAPVPASGATPLRLAHTDWLFHHLAVTGPAEALAAFGAAAAGAGTVPWAIDFDLLEEDWFHRFMAPADRTLSLTGARVLAGQLRQAAEHRHALATARVGRSRACPFDLHALVPVPPDILALEPDHPDSLAWLWQHWGTTEPLRHVAADQGAGRRDAGEPGLRFDFWAADWSPWRAIEHIRAGWPILRFDLRPRYDAA